MDRYIISLDLDGTVADFNKKASEVLGRTLVGHDNNIEWDILAEKCPTLYKDLELLPDAKELIKFVLTRYPNRTSVLTAIPKKAIFPEVTAHKREWVKKNIGPSIKTNFGPYSIDKQFHCLGNHHILIDDNPLCIEQWIRMGGLGILHSDAASTINVLQDIGF